MITGLRKNPRYMRRSAIVLRNPSRAVGEPHLPSANCPISAQRFGLTPCARVPESHRVEGHRSDCQVSGAPHCPQRREYCRDLASRLFPSVTRGSGEVPVLFCMVASVEQASILTPSKKKEALH